LLAWAFRPEAGGAARAAGVAGAVVLAGAAVWGLSLTPAPSGPLRAEAMPDGAELWSPEKEAAFRGQGKQVFVNFTADWCVTCKVNEAGVFTDPAVRAALTADNTAWLVADWTRRDAAIAAALSSHGRSGVPLYLVWKPGAVSPVVLPQLPDRAAVLAALEGS
jgi:thiol:disulfide interchange protein